MKLNYYNGLYNFTKDLKHFGLDPALAIFYTKVFPYTIQKDSKFAYWLNKNKHRAILKYLKTKYGHVLKLPSTKENLNNQAESKTVIWSLWWQGKDMAPELVKMCFSSLEYNSKDHELIVVDKNNFNQYIELPEYILDKVEKGYITFTQFSDIIRAYLLYNYGGIWIDSTMLAVKEIPKELFETEFFIGKLHREPIGCISEMRWVGSFMAGKPNNLYCYVMLEFFLAYWKEENRLIDYFLIDYIAELILNNISEAKEMYDGVPFTNSMMYKFNLNSKYDKDEFNKLTRDTFIFKNQRKDKFNKIDAENELTYFGFFYNKYIQRDSRDIKNTVM